MGVSWMTSLHILVVPKYLAIETGQCTEMLFTVRHSAWYSVLIAMNTAQCFTYPATDNVWNRHDWQTYVLYCCAANLCTTGHKHITDQCNNYIIQCTACSINTVHCLVYQHKIITVNKKGEMIFTYLNFIVKYTEHQQVLDMTTDFKEGIAAPKPRRITVHSQSLTFRFGG